MRPLNIAHRGGAGLMPENTLAAFEDARARGCDGAELDVQLSADSVAVVHHDFRLMAGVARKDGAWLAAPGPRIKDLTVAELRQFDVGRTEPHSDYAVRHPLVKPVAGARVPTLEEVAALRSSNFRLFVELKCDAGDDSADPLALAEAAFAVTGRDAVYVGFDWRALTVLVTRGAECWFTTDRLTTDARPVIDLIAAAGAKGWFPHFPDATPQNVAYARERGLKIGSWTVNDPAEMNRLAGLDALCTDRPDLLQAFEQGR
jgi:glycerophosphoryl diester phosphodiesterase